MECKQFPETLDPQSKASHFLMISSLLFAVLIICSWFFIFYIDDVNLGHVFSAKNRIMAMQFIKRLFIDNDHVPAYLNFEKIQHTMSLMVQTFQMSVIGIVLSTAAMLLSLIPLINPLKNHDSHERSHWSQRLIRNGIQTTFLISRAIPELIWAMLLVFILKPGILPGALALAIHNYGILGKLCLEVVEHIKTAPLQSIVQSGGSNKQILIYGVLPMAIPKFITYIIYRWEVILRTTIVVGMVGAGGLGSEFKLRMSWFHYTDITLLLVAYLLLVYLSDFLSASLRRS